MRFRDRIKELRRVKASELQPHPENWREHPPEQTEALRAILSEVGFADALLVRELPGGSLQILDGHLRAETSADQLVPVLVLDVDDTEAAKILATHDTITELAQPDFTQLEALAAQCNFEAPSLRNLFDQLDNIPTLKLHQPEPKRRKRKVNVVESYQVVVTCADEREQREVFELLTSRGHECRLLLL